MSDNTNTAVGETKAATAADEATFAPVGVQNGVATGEKRKAEEAAPDADKKAKVDEVADKGKGKGKSDEPAEEAQAPAPAADDDDEDPENLIITGKRNRNKVNYADPEAAKKADLKPGEGDDEEDDEDDQFESPDDDDDEDAGDYQEGDEEEDDEDDDEEDKD